LNARARTFVVAGLVVVAGTAVVLHFANTRPFHRFGDEAKGVRASAPTGGVVAWLDVNSPTLAGVLPSVLRHMDEAFGYPWPSYYQDGGRAPKFDVRHHTSIHAHCTEKGRYAVPFLATTVEEWQHLITECKAGIEANEAPPECAAIIQAPPLLTTLDSSWSNCWWTTGTPPLPIDDYDGGTP